VSTHERAFAWGLKIYSTTVFLALQGQLLQLLGQIEVVGCSLMGCIDPQLLRCASTPRHICLAFAVSERCLFSLTSSVSADLSR
jgi:hypothetical protein